MNQFSGKKDLGYLGTTLLSLGCLPEMDDKGKFYLNFIGGWQDEAQTAPIIAFRINIGTIEDLEGLEATLRRAAWEVRNPEP